MKAEFVLLVLACVLSVSLGEEEEVMCDIPLLQQQLKDDQITLGKKKLITISLHSVKF